MTSNKPYLIRAIYEWIVDNHLTPYLVLNTKFRGVHVPQQFIEDDQIVLNISPSATQQLLISESIEFQARFGGRLTAIYAPTEAAIAIYAMENGKGMIFPEEEFDDTDNLTPDFPPSGDKPSGQPPRGKPKLTVVK